MIQGLMDLRASTAVEQNHQQKLYLDAESKKWRSSSGAIPVAKLWLMNSDQPNLSKNG